MPVQVKFTFTTGNDTTITVWNDEAYQVFPVSFDDRINNMEFDPDDWILKSASYVNVENDIKPATPYEFKLTRNYPNPFNNRTCIEYTMGADENVLISIYNIEGKLVADLFNGYQERGIHKIYWDGRNNSGNESGSGIYIINMKSDSFINSQKIILVK
jgi:hypothetical protein